MINKKHQTQTDRTSIYTCFFVEVSKVIKYACPADLTGLERFFPTVKPFLRIAVITTL